MLGCSSIEFHRSILEGNYPGLELRGRTRGGRKSVLSGVTGHRTSPPPSSGACERLQRDEDAWRCAGRRGAKGGCRGSAPGQGLQRNGARVFIGGPSWYTGVASIVTC